MNFVPLATIFSASLMPRRSDRAVELFILLAAEFCEGEWIDDDCEDYGLLDCDSVLFGR
jgi:hypothetical protein